jgi:hypothetical protein
MISTKNMQLLPDAEKLRAACKSMSVLDAILCQDWTYRYYSYNSEWGEGEEFCEMRNGEGAQLLILFREEGTVINGFSAEAAPADKTELQDRLPAAFHEFIFGEPVNSAGTTFCLWKAGDEEWQSWSPVKEDNHSEELLSGLDGEPATYHKWATEYFKGSYKESGIPIAVVTRIFAHEALTDDLVTALVEEMEDWELLKDDLREISYPYHINR